MNTNFEEREIVLELIDEPESAMRTEIPRDEIFELASDIKKNGLINPITVRPKGERFEVVAGHRRFLAHRYGGLVKIRCIVRELSDAEAFAVMTSENLKREQVNVVDEAMHAKRALEYCQGDHEAAAKMCGETRYWLDTRLKIAEMDDDLREALRKGEVKIGVALALLEIGNELDRRTCLSMAISQGATLVVVNYWVAQWKAGLFGSGREVETPDSNVPGGMTKEVMLKDAIDGKEYPAREFVSILIRRDNMGYIEALRQHLSSQPAADEQKEGEIEDATAGHSYAPAVSS